MTKTKLHPSVEKFKEFVKQNPQIIKEVRAGNTTWQELYEDWYLLGEEDSRWDSYKENKDEAQKPEEKKMTGWEVSWVLLSKWMRIKCRGTSVISARPFQQYRVSFPNSRAAARNHQEAQNQVCLNQAALLHLKRIKGLNR